MAKRALPAVLVLLALTSAPLACGDDPTQIVSPADVIAVSGDAQIGTVGEPLARQITARVVDAGGDPIGEVDATFETQGGSLSPASATTATDGTVSSTWTLGTTAGEQEATASADGVSATFTATAEAAAASSLAITPVTPDTFTALDATAQLSANAQDPYGNPVSAVTWSSSDIAIATIDSTGLVTAVANGTARIAATSGSVADTVDVLVAQEAASVSIAGATDRLAWSDSLWLAGTVLDANGYPVTDATLTWSSGDPTIASVDTAGMVMGRALGSVGIIAAADALADTFAVTVTPIPGASMAAALGGCLLEHSGAAYCWGLNDHGQLGDGTTTARNEPVAVAGEHRFVALSNGNGLTSGNHFCGLTADGAASCWGKNDYGQLGDGTTTTHSTTPVAVAGGHTFRQIGVGVSHTCALDTLGHAYCWGRNEYGQLGDGTTTNKASPTAVVTWLTFDEIAVAGRTTCALDGTDAYCWGDNRDGAVGDGTTSHRHYPMAVTGSHPFETLTGGYLHVCGMTTSGAPYCWGNNGSGQIGDGTTTNSSSPVSVNSLGTVDEIASGSAHTCAVASGTVYCWGWNGDGQLGDGTITSRTTPTTVAGDRSFTGVRSGYSVSCGLDANGAVYCWGYRPHIGARLILYQTAPDPVSGGQKFTEVSAGQDITCAATSSSAYCWGSNQYGQLGLGHVEVRTMPTQITAVDLVRVSAGAWHACGLTSEGTAYCWGDNSDGMLGDGTTTASAVPVAVNVAFAFSSITASPNHTCGIRASDGAAYCWGSNSYGQVGDGSTTNRLSPTAVSGSHAFADLNAGAGHTCGVTTAGAAYCWGSNSYGQVGDGTTTNRLSPTEVTGSYGFVRVVAGGNHSCGWTSGNVGYCWGFNNTGQVGDGTTTYRTAPTEVSGVRFVSMSAGLAHTCGVSASGTGYCWGLGLDGRLGNGSRSNETTPTVVLGDLTLASVSAGESHSCGITTGGTTYCWGYVGHGELGNGTAFFAEPTAVSGGYAVTVPLLADGSGFNWGTPTLVGESLELTAEPMEARANEIEAARRATREPENPK